jgi:predicted transcriptional regulator
MSRFNCNVNIRITEEQKMKLEMLARERQLDISDLGREAIREYLKRHLSGKPLEQTELLEVGK